MKERINSNIKFSQLLLVVVCLVIGLIMNNLIQNISDKELLNFSTIELISFTITILLSASSFVLAILAISMSRSSEKLLIDRNDKGINQQSELFMRTIEILNRIESSTGVTEKRIEDIIAGRTGELTSKLVRDKIIPQSSKEKLDKEFEIDQSKKFVSKEEKEREIAALQQKKEVLENALKYYKESTKNLFSKIANTDSINLINIGEGDINGSGDDLLDAFYKKGDFKFGICFYIETDFLNHKPKPDEYESFVEKLIVEIKNNTFNIVFITLDKQGTLFNLFNDILSQKSQIVKDEIMSKIKILVGDSNKLYDEIIKTIQ